MLEGLMQHDYPLTLQHLLDRMRRLYAQDGEVVSVRDGERKTSVSYGEIVERVDKLGRRARRAWASSPAIASPPSPGTSASTSRSTWPCRAWAPCSTP